MVPVAYGKDLEQTGMSLVCEPQLDQLILIGMVTHACTMLPIESDYVAVTLSYCFVLNALCAYIL